jgi:hypothetical protein
VIDPPPPAELALLTEAIGAEATLALIEARAGTRIYVSMRSDADGVLTGIVGAKAAAALAATHGGCYVAVPSAKRWRSHVYRGRQMSIAQIAHALRLNERTVQRYLATSLGTRQHERQVPKRHPALRPIAQTELPL